MKKILSIFLILLSGTACIFAAAAPAYDPGFGIGGYVQTNIQGTDDIADVAVQNDGKIVALGRNGSNAYLLTRYLPSGSLDPGFSSDGIATIVLAQGVANASKLCVGTDNTSYALGTLIQDAKTFVVIRRFSETGEVDNTFLSGFISLPSAPVDCAVQNDGKLLFTYVHNGHFATVRLNLDGTFDQSFGGVGLVGTIPADATNSLPAGIGVQDDGKIVVVGSRNNLAETVLIRYNANGRLDTTFSGDGIQIFNLSGTTEFLQSVVFQSDGKIVFLGSQIDSKVKVGRLNTDGSFDVSFGASGVVTIDFPESTSDAANRLFIQPDRKILVSALAVSTGFHKIFRLNSANGSIDSQFGNNGIFTNKRARTAGRFFVDVSGERLFAGFIGGTGDFSVEAYNLRKTPIVPSDFDGDGFTDVGVFRPSTGQWFVQRSSDNVVIAAPFGQNGDVPIDGDFDGDGKSDFAIFRPSNGVWFFLRSSDNTTFGATFGVGTDKPITGDFDKDGKSDIAFFRPASGEWFVLRSSANFASFFGFPFGANGDIPTSSERK